MKYGVQIVSLGVIVAILINYFRSRKMPLASTRVFTAFFWTSLLNIIFELCTLHTIELIDVIPFQNRLAHQLFIGSADATVFLLFLYVDLKARGLKRYNVFQLLIRLLPLAVSLCVVVFGDLYYNIGPDVSYSYGPMATTVYTCVALYIAAILYLLSHNRGSFTRSSRTSIFLGISFWAVVAIFQFFNPTKLLSSMGVSIMVLFMYISFEHPTEYVDPEIEHCRNRKAFDLILSEKFSKKKPFYIVSIHLLKEPLLVSSIGSRQFQQLLSRMSRRLCGCSMSYHTRSNVLSVVLRKREYERFKSLPNLPLDYRDEEVHIEAGYFISVIACPVYAKNSEDVTALINFISDIGERREYSGVKVADEETLRDMQYLSGVEKLLQTAIADDGFDVFYQPIYSTQDKTFVSSEALIRIKDTATMGYISPEIFIPIAEQKGLIKEIGAIVFEKVCSFAKENRLFEGAVKYIEINLSGVQSVDSTLVDSLNSIMQKYGIDPRCINLEITETAAVENGKLMLENMRRLKELGCQFSMDDFGTGYSNLAQMADTEFDLIKLDKSLLWAGFEENGDKARCILNGCIDLIQSLKLHIVQEGVETKEQAEYLTNKGVAYLQGYYYSRPVNGESYLAFLQKNDCICNEV